MIRARYVNVALAALVSFLLTTLASAYPLDGLEESGIRRLQEYTLPHRTAPVNLVAGQLLHGDQIVLRMQDYDGPDFDKLPEDAELAGFLTRTLRQRDSSYGMVLVDMTDPAALRWAGLRPDVKQNAGSVGKLLCMAALFHALAEAFPDTGERARVLRESLSPAGGWVSNESHKVPKWNEKLQRNLHSVIVPSDEFRLSEWLDHAISASANGAGSIIWREAMLIRHFGSEYPQSFVQSEQFFAETPKAKLAEMAQALVMEPLVQAGIDTANLQQGSFWTTTSKRKVPGRVSFATPRELARLGFRIEQGRLVDAWSSLQMKKYMYLTKRRYRYSYAPELGTSAVFFKSGSLYSCKPETDFRCEKYKGNERNLMNSVAMVEGIGEAQPHYLAVLMSNVLKVNSAWDHSRIAAAVHETIRTKVPQKLRESASEQEMQDSGKSD